MGSDPFTVSSYVTTRRLGRSAESAIHTSWRSNMTRRRSIRPACTVWSTVPTEIVRSTQSFTPPFHCVNVHVDRACHHRAVRAVGRAVEQPDRVVDVVLLLEVLGGAPQIEDHRAVEHHGLRSDEIPVLELLPVGLGQFEVTVLDRQPRLAIAVVVRIRSARQPAVCWRS